MFPGVLALVDRSLRVDARSYPSHMARLGLMGAIYGSLCVAVWNSAWFGAPGLRFFYGIGYLNLAFMTLLGIGFFSTSITEEKEEDTLGLMLMAGISPLGILIGKSGGRAVQALLLIAVQYPFTLLAVTMGGVTQNQVSAMYLGLAGYVVLLAGFGLLCSTLAPRNRSAANWMVGGLAVYVLAPFVTSYVLWQLFGGVIPVGRGSSSLWLFVLDRITRFSVFQQMGTILTTGFGDSVWSWQVISNAIAGIVCFGISWALFGIGSRQVATEASSRGLVTRSRGRLRWFSPGRAWGNPFVWKDFYFVSGGLGMIPARLAFCVGLFGVAMLFGRASGAPRSWYVDISFYQVFLSLAVVIDAGRVLARSLHDEVQGRTVSSLMMLPTPPLAVIYSKFAGALLGWTPGLLIDFVVSVGTHEGRQNFEWIATEGVGLCVTSYFVLMPNLAALLSLYMRWGAVATSVAAAIGIHTIMIVGLRGGGPNQEAFAMIGLFIAGVCIACHVAIYYRFRALAASSS